MDSFENTIDSFEQDIDSSSSGTITTNKEQGLRKSCSFTLVNIDNKYTINENNPFWFNRKFRLWLGVSDDVNTFWFAKGVYITQDATMNSVNGTVTINGVDKYGILDGTLKTLSSDVCETTYESGSKVGYVIRDTLMLNIGNDFVVDPIQPLIDYDTENSVLYQDFTLAAGDYYGALLDEICSCFGADVYYDNMGRLIVERIFNEDTPYWYVFKSPSYEFDYSKPHYLSPQLKTSLTGINKVTVQVETNDDSDEIVSYTAYNNNPRSPLCYDKIGARTYEENGGIIYINAGDSSIDTPEIKCKEYAEYFLMQETCLSLSQSLSCPLLPHINEGDVITITDEQLGLDQTKFIVNSMTIPLGVGEISLDVTNINYLPTCLDNSALSAITSVSTNLYALEYNINGATGTAPSGGNYTSGKMVKIAGQTTTDSEGVKRKLFDLGGSYFSGWKDDVDSSYYSPYTYFSMPMQDVTLKAQWTEYEYDETELANDVLTVVINSNTLTSYSFSSLCTEDALFEYVQIRGTDTYFDYSGDNYAVSIDFPATAYFNGFSQYYYNKDALNINKLMAMVSAYGRNYQYSLDGGIPYSLTFPNSITEITFNDTRYSFNGYNTDSRQAFSCDYWTSVTFPTSLTKIDFNQASDGNLFYNSYNLTALNMITDNPITFSRYNTTTSSGSIHIGYYCPKLVTVTFSNDAIFKFDNENASNCTYMFYSGDSSNTTLKTITFNKNLTIENAYFGCGGDSPGCDTIVIGGNLILYGRSATFLQYFGSSSYRSSYPSLEIGGDFILHPTSNVSCSYRIVTNGVFDNIEIGGSFDASGMSSAGTATLFSYLTINYDFIIGQDLTIMSQYYGDLCLYQTTATNFRVGNNLNLTITSSKSGYTTTVGYYLNVSDTFYIGGDFNVSGVTSDFRCMSYSTIGTLQIVGALNVGNSGSITCFYYGVITDYVYIGKINVTNGSSAFYLYSGTSGYITIYETINVAYASRLFYYERAKSLAVGGDITISYNSFFSDSAEYSEGVQLSGNFTCTNSTAFAYSIITNGLSILGNVIIDTLYSNPPFHYAAIESGDLILGNTTIQNNSNAFYHLAVHEGVIIGDSSNTSETYGLTITNDTVFNSATIGSSVANGVTINGSVNSNNSSSNYRAFYACSIYGDFTVNGDVNCNGGSFITNSTSIDGDFTVNGDVNLSGDLLQSCSIYNDVIIHGDFNQTSGTFLCGVAGVSNLTIDGDVSVASDCSFVASSPSITTLSIGGNLTITNPTYFMNNAMSASSLSLSSVSVGGDITVTTNISFGMFAGFTTITSLNINSLTVNNSYSYSNYFFNQLSITELNIKNIDLQSANAFLGCQYLTDAVVNGDVNLKNSYLFQVNNLALTSLTIEGDVSITDGSAVGQANTDSVTYIAIYGSVLIDSTSFFFVSIPSTEANIYFYNDDVQIESSNALTTFNGTIHGINGGNVEAFATERGFAFEALDSEESGENTESAETTE